MGIGIFFIYFSLTFGCVTKLQDKGLLTLQKNKMILTNIDGQVYHIHSGKDKIYLTNLSGCILQIKGALLLNHLFVDDWMVYDAGSGSAPFIGPLKRIGIQWSISDHNTKGIVILEGLENYISPQEGRVILLGGYVVGAQRLKVVSARYIDKQE